MRGICSCAHIRCIYSRVYIDKQNVCTRKFVYEHSGKEAEDTNPCDASYDKLKTELVPVDKTSLEFKVFVHVVSKHVSLLSHQYFL